MNEFIQALLSPDVPFIRYAFIAGVLSSISFGIIGSFVVVKRMSYIAGAISHTVLGGIGLALFLQGVLNLKFITPMFGAVVFSIGAGLFISITIIKGNERLDTIIGTVWAVGMSVGLLFMYITPGYIDPMSYLFGNILLISSGDLILIVVLNIIVIFFSIFFFNQLQAICFDLEFAKIKRINTSFFQIFLVILISITVLLLVTLVGIVMVIALLTIPAAIAGMYVNQLKKMIPLAIVICAFFTTFGLVISHLIKLPTSSVTVVLAGITFFVAMIFNKILKR